MNDGHGWAEVNGARLYYEDTGPSSGKTIVLLHGFSLDARMWDAQVEALAPGARVIRYDLRGFGRSTVPNEAAYAHVEDLRALLDLLEVNSACLIGLSMGGGIAVDFALTYPERASCVVLIDAVIGGHRWSPEASARSRQIWQAARDRGIEAAKRLWLDHPYFAQVLSNPATGQSLRHMFLDYSGWHFLNSDPGWSPQPPATSRLSQLAVPTLVIVGELDQPDLHHMANLLAQEVPDARLDIIEGAGHMASMEAPSRVNRAISSFLESLTG